MIILSMLKLRVAVPRGGTHRMAKVHDLVTIVHGHVTSSHVHVTLTGARRCSICPWSCEEREGEQYELCKDELWWWWWWIGLVVEGSLKNPGMPHVTLGLAPCDLGIGPM